MTTGGEMFVWKPSVSFKVDAPFAVQDVLNIIVRGEDDKPLAHWKKYPGQSGYTWMGYKDIPQDSIAEVMDSYLAHQQVEKEQKEKAKAEEEQNNG